MYAGGFQGRRASCQVELCRTRVNFAARPSGYGQDLFLLPFWRQCFGAEMFPRLPLAFRCSSAVAFGCGRNSTDPAHIRWQMRWALRLDGSLREQLKTKSDIHPLNLCSEDLWSCSAEPGDALKPRASYFLLMNDGVCTDSLLSSKPLSDPKSRRVPKTECRTFWLEQDGSLSHSAGGSPPGPLPTCTMLHQIGPHVLFCLSLPLHPLHLLASFHGNNGARQRTRDR